MQNDTAVIMLSTIPGLEEITANDVKKLLGEFQLRRAVPTPFDVRGYLLIEVPFSKRIGVLSKLFHEGRSFEHVYEVLFYHPVSEHTLEEINNLLCGEEVAGSIERLFSSRYMTFSVVVKKEVECGFTSRDIATSVGDTIVMLVQKTLGFKPKVSLDNPDLCFMVQYTERYLVFSLDLTYGVSLGDREYRRYHHPAALKGVVAYLMAMFAGVDKARRVLDPMCGSGTLLIEAAYLNPNAEYYGVERDKNHVSGALLNVEKAGLKDKIKIIHGDGTRLEEIFPRNYFDLVLVNPPYGIRIKTNILVLYEKLLISCRKVLKRNGKVAVVTPRIRALIKAVKGTGFKITRKIKFFHGGLYREIILLEVG
ncbi:MAG: RNA methyltransferase [Thermoproteales archaeon]|nr:RNA methyltransferase [Thermoproteales archaeon]